MVHVDVPCGGEGHLKVKGYWLSKGETQGYHLIFIWCLRALQNQTDLSAAVLHAVFT